MIPSNFLINISSVLLTLSLFARNGICKSISTGLPMPPRRENRNTTPLLEALVENGTTPLDCTAVFDTTRNGLIDTRYRWQSFNVYVDPAYNSNERTLINNAMFRLNEAVPCLPFMVYPPGVAPSGDYVHTKKLSGCWSYIGRRGRAQELSLQSPGCMSIGTIMHELIHALGFHHEQSRSDRDDFVTVLWENISPGREHNFNKYSSNLVTSFGVPYNTRSIMHYYSTAFSSNGRQTIVAKDGSPVGSTGDLQQTDIDKLRAMYNC